MTMDWDPSKHPRRPAGSSSGGEFTRAAERSAGAQMARMDKAHADAKMHAHKLAQGKTEADIATEAGYPPGHEQHWAFRNGLAQARRASLDATFREVQGFAKQAAADYRAILKKEPPVNYEAKVIRARMHYLMKEARRGK